MATKTFEELKQLAIQIRDEKTNKQNTATRIGTQMLEHLNKLEQDYYDKTATDEELKQRDEKLTELSSNTGLYNVDKNVPLESRFYTSSTARAAIPTSVRKLGLIITYKTDATTCVTEQFVGSDILSWYTETNWKNVGSEGGNKILEWNTDAATTRKQVTLEERKAGMQISYKLNGENWVNEQYIGTSLTDTEWAKDDNWNKISTDLELEVFARQNSEILGKSETIEKTTSESNKKFSLKVYNGENYEYIIENLSDIKTANFLFFNGSRVVKSIPMSVGEIIRGFIEIKDFVENDGLFIGANVSQQSNTHFKCTISLTNTLVEDVNNLKETSLEKSDVDFIRSLEDVREEDFEYILDRSSVVGTIDVSNVLFTTRDTILNNAALVSLEFNSIPTVADNTFYIGQVIYNEENTQATITRIYSFPMPTDSKTIDLGGVEFKKNEYFLFGMEKADACFKWRYADMGVTFDFNGVNHNVGSMSTTTTSRGKYAPIKIYANKGQLILPNIVSYIDNKIKGPESSAEKRIVSVDDATTVLMNGSSLTNAICHTSSTSWIERLNDIVDVVLINNGKSGKNFRYNIQSLIEEGAIAQITSDANNTPRKLKPKYIFFCNSANGSENGYDGYQNLRNAKFVCESYGAKMLLGTEEQHTATESGLPEKWDYDSLYRSFAASERIPYSPMLNIWKKCYPMGNRYEGGFMNNHGGYRAVAPYSQHYDLLGHLPIRKNVKMFKVRPTYKSGSPTIDDLSYDDNIQRLQYFTAISPGKLPGSFPPSGIDNLDNHEYDVPTVEEKGTSVNESSYMCRREYVPFNKFALVEFILDKIMITKGKFSINCSVEPTSVYIAHCNNTENTYTQKARTLFTKVEHTYSENILSCSFTESADIQAYDKIRIIIECNGDFNLKDPIFEDYDGIDKNVEQLKYSYRKYGKELFSATSMDDWTVNGTAEITSFPIELQYYTTYNESKKHLELKAENDYATKNFTVETGSKKIAVRIVGQMFTKYATTRYDGQSIEGIEKYVSSENQYTNYDYDYGKIRVTLLFKNPNRLYYPFIVREVLMYQGWAESYLEFDIDNDSTEMQIKIEKVSHFDDSYNNDDKPIIIHDVSIQKLNEYAP